MIQPHPDKNFFQITSDIDNALVKHNFSTPTWYALSYGIKSTAQYSVPTWIITARLDIIHRSNIEIIKILVHEIAHHNWYNKHEYMAKDYSLQYSWISMSFLDTTNSIPSKCVDYLRFFNEWLTEIYAEQIFNTLKNEHIGQIDSTSEEYFSTKSAYEIPVITIYSLAKQLWLSEIQVKENLIHFYKSWDIQWFQDFLFAHNKPELTTWLLNRVAAMMRWE